MILVPPARIAEYRAAGWWGSRTLFDLFLDQAAARPDCEAVVDAANRSAFAHGAPQRWTWARLRDQVERCCVLLMDCNLRRDDIVVVQMPNCVEQFMVYLACARMGIIVSPVPVQYREHELRHILVRTRAAAVFTFAHIGKRDAPHAAAALFMRLQFDLPELRCVIAFGDAVPEGAWRADDRLEHPATPAGRAAIEAQVAREPVTADDVFTLCWTSGTEAAPKGVPRSHNEWLVVAPSIIEAARLEPGARLLNPFPMVNMAGISTAFIAWLTLGATVVQHQPFSLPVFLDQIRQEHIDYTVAPPTVLNTLLQNESLLQGIDFTRLARIGSGSAPLSDAMVQGFSDRYGVEIVNYFGSNEGAALTSCARDIPDPRLRAQFFPRAGVEGFDWSISTTRKIRTRLVDLQTGADIRVAGVAGELRFRGPTIFSGYYAAPELTARAFDEEGYYKTGDLFEIAGDEAQYFRFVGRSKDLVIRGGMNISSEELENLLAACPGVGEVAVVGVPDPLLGEKVCVCVVPAAEGPRPTLPRLVDFLRNERHIALYKLPEYVMEVAALARNPIGKVLKRELREWARERLPVTTT